MGPVGVQEMIAIFVVALILFGPKKLPELGRTLGKALSEFRRAKNELKASFETHLNELEREARLSSSESSTTPDYSSPRSSHPYEDYGHPSYDSASAHEAPAYSADGAEHAGSLQSLPSPESAPVEGTVPRSNGYYSGEVFPASTEQDRTP